MATIPSLSCGSWSLKLKTNMGVRLEVLGRSGDAVAAYQQVIDRYGDDFSPGVREAVFRASEALSNTGCGMH